MAQGNLSTRCKNINLSIKEKSYGGSQQGDKPGGRGDLEKTQKRIKEKQCLYVETGNQAFQKTNYQQVLYKGI